MDEHVGMVLPGLIDTHAHSASFPHKRCRSA